jgi:O-antigen ligase
MIKSLPKIYFSLLVLSPLVPRFDTVDVIAADYIALTIVAIFGVLILIIQKETISSDIKFKAPLILVFSFLIISLISISFSLNKVTALISFIKLLVIVVHLYLIYALRIYKLLSINYILSLCSVLLLIEIFYSLYPLYNEILPVRKYEYRFSTFLTGITGNRNITAASIVLKIPLVALYLFRSNNNYLKYLLGTLLIFAITNIFFLSSRAALLSLLLVLVVYYSNIILRFIREKNFKFFIKRILLISAIIASSYIYFSYNIVENNRASIQSRVSSISSTDESATERLRFYRQAFGYFIEHPLKPVGLGNWKLYSIKLDKDKINSYIIPYVVHNDFLEILVETSLIGFLLYSGFFLILIYMIYGLYLKQKDFNIKTEILLVGMALFSYLVDANLNFPLYRPLMQVNLLLVITLVLSYFNLMSDEKNA